MTAFADYSYYTTNYCRSREPVIGLAEFDFYADKATAEIDRLTFGNITDASNERIKHCCCEIAEMMYKHDKAVEEHGGVVSESVGGWSKSYEGEESQRQLLSQKIYACIRSWLSGTGLLFSGVKKC